MKIILIICKCKKRLDIPIEYAGKRIRCRHCQAQIQVPGIAGAKSPPTKVKNHEDNNNSVKENTVICDRCGARLDNGTINCPSCRPQGHTDLDSQCGEVSENPVYQKSYYHYIMIGVYALFAFASILAIIGFHMMFIISGPLLVSAVVASLLTFHDRKTHDLNVEWHITQFAVHITFLPLVLLCVYQIIVGESTQPENSSVDIPFWYIFSAASILIGGLFVILLVPTGLILMKIRPHVYRFRFGWFLLHIIQSLLILTLLFYIGLAVLLIVGLINLLKDSPYPYNWS